MKTKEKILKRTHKINTEYLQYGDRSRSGAEFKPDNPGRPAGILSNTTILKNKIIDYALGMDFDEKEERFDINERGQRIKKYIRTIPKRQILQLASTLLPKELAIKGMPDTKIFNNIKVGKTEEEIVNSLNSRFMQQFSKEKITETPVSEEQAGQS